MINRFVVVEITQMANSFVILNLRFVVVFFHSEGYSFEFRVKLNNLVSFSAKASAQSLTRNSGIPSVPDD